eukprot:7348174-Ditylum_brightwellii.AAC.1
MNPVYYLKYVILAHEFGKSKGSLHSHSGGITNGTLDIVSSKIGDIISELAHQVVAAVDALDKYILSVYFSDKHESSFGHSPLLYCDFKALEKRENFCDLTESRKRAFKEYQSSIAADDDNAGKKISHLLETYWGIHACHPGHAPDDWVMPGGLPQMGYHSNLDDMQKSKDVLKRKELKQFKLN